jgi:hypothetical protein
MEGLPVIVKKLIDPEICVSSDIAIAIAAFLTRVARYGQW